MPPERSFLIAHGLYGSPEGHWQPWLHGELLAAGEDSRFPQFTDPDDPDPATWMAEMAGALDAMPGRRNLLAHSLSCVTWIRGATEGAMPRVDRVLLVAPPTSADWDAIVRFRDFTPDPARVRAAAGEALIVCSDADPYAPEGAVTAFATPLGLPHHLIAGAGHINGESGFGPWPWVRDWALR